VFVLLKGEEKVRIGVSFAREHKTKIHSNFCLPLSKFEILEKIKDKELCIYLV
jgi:hypothetical protein